MSVRVLKHDVENVTVCTFLDLNCLNYHLKNQSRDLFIYRFNQKFPLANNEVQNNRQTSDVYVHYAPVK